MRPSGRLQLLPSPSDQATIGLLEKLGCAITLEVKGDRPRHADIDPLYDIDQAARGKQYLEKLLSPGKEVLIISGLVYITPGHDPRQLHLARPEKIDLFSHTSAYGKSLLDAALAYFGAELPPNPLVDNIKDLNKERLVQFEDSLDIYREGYTNGQKNGSTRPGMSQFFPGKDRAEITGEMKKAVGLINRAYVAAAAARAFKTADAQCEVSIGSEAERRHPSIDVLVITTPRQAAERLAELEWALGPIHLSRDIREKLSKYNN